MKRQICVMILAMLAAVRIGGTEALAAEGTEAFTPVREYGGQFIDVQAGDWYYENVKALYELGLTNGKGAENRYAPGDDVTVGEIVAMTARLRSLYDNGNSEAGASDYGFYATEGWYMPYVYYLQEAGVIGDEFSGAYGKAATRGEMAHILARALPETYFKPVNETKLEIGYRSGRFISDVGEDTAYREEILQLYRRGILSGTDSKGTYQPEKSIPRGEVAAMVTRLAYSDLRVGLDWDLMTAIIDSDGTFVDAPGTGDTAAIDADIRYMLSRGERSVTLNYSNGMDSEKANEIMTAFLVQIRNYLEQTYNEIECNFTGGGMLSLTFGSSFYEADKIGAYRKDTMDAAIAVRDKLWADGTVTAEMTEYEKARAYFEWLCRNCRYDFETTSSSMSHTGYSAFVNGVAVCDGYTSAYNLLLRLEGISCATRSTSNHIWTVAELDGATYHIDPTWGYQPDGGDINKEYFGMTEEESMARFS